MQEHHLPRLDLRFWCGLTAASVLGADLGDFGAHNLGLGHVEGLPILAAIFAILLLVERFLNWRTEALYWAVIVVVRAAATNLGDLATHDLKLSYPATIVVLALALGALALWQQEAGRGFPFGGRPSVGASYWLAMFLAATLGTALGDDCADLIGLGASSLIWAAVWAVALAATLIAVPYRATAYWGMVAVVRTLGTNLGDYSCDGDGLGLGLAGGSLAAFALLVLVLVLWRPRREAVAAAD